MSKAGSFIKSIPHRLKEYFSTYWKKINYPLYIGLILLAIGLFVLDIVSKHWAYNHFDGYTGVTDTFIPYILDFTLVFNNGAAWNWLADQKWILVTISTIATIGLFTNLVFRFTSYNKLMMVGIALMLPGAAGNLVDRIGYWAQAGIYTHGVIDFLQFDFAKWFPVCNVADYALTVGIVILIIGFVIEFKKEWAAIKAEEEAEKQAGNLEETKKDEEDMMKKLSQLNEEEHKEGDVDGNTETDRQD